MLIVIFVSLDVISFSVTSISFRGGTLVNLFSSCAGAGTKATRSNSLRVEKLSSGRRVFPAGLRDEPRFWYAPGVWTPSRLLCTGRAFSRGEFERILQA